MGMSTSVRGVRDLDGQFQKMQQVLLACREAGVSIPEKVKTYFLHDYMEDIDYLRKAMQEVDISEAVVESCIDASNVYEVDLSKLSPEVKSIRFKNSW